MIRLLCTIIIGSIALTAPLTADTVDESALFDTDTDSVQTLVPSDFISAVLEKQSTQFTGQLFSRSIVTGQRSTTITDAQMISYSQANLFLDTRLQKGTKVFMNLELSQLASANATQGTYANIRELFLDFNLNRTVYVRTGKQVLQWGRSYFWNPTDLVNTEYRDFFQLNRFRDGTYGTRVHIPNGSDQNLYFFINQQNVSRLSDLSIAAKIEFLLGNSEIGLSTWQKRNAVSLYGIDVSTRFFNLDIKAESAFSYGENLSRVKIVDGIADTYTVRDEWVNKTSLTIQKSWDWDLPERMSLTGELFYNSHGYTQSTFANETLRSALIDQNLYRPNMNNQWYSALFFTINRFPLSDMSMSFNTISNWADSSNITALSLSYTPIDHVTFNSALYGYWGDPNGEYTYSGNSLAIEGSGSIDF